MSKATYPTKYQLEHLKKRINSEIDPLIDQAELSVKSIVADLTVKAQTFFGKISNKELKDKLSWKFDKNDRDSYYRSNHNKGITPEDCRDQIREWAQFLAEKEAEKTPEGKKVKELELYKQSAINSVFECGVPDQLNVVLEKVLSGVGIVWNKTKALQITNERYN